ncbi:hypothetical protein Y1Q_0008696 [Alligator mississippiensis]|uniref:Uncharacterized protein n=1 Tax=Alligator mississippiensis TaxID=8496 RepID=A0A151N9K2_ALLMI|nr:hypothetical protein Y1Q_0008696 [Alligator mississippiensis]
MAPWRQREVLEAVAVTTIMGLQKANQQFLEHHIDVPKIGVEQGAYKPECMCFDNFRLAPIVTGILE